MTTNKLGYRVPDAYTACTLLIGFDKEERKLKLVMSHHDEVDKAGKWSIPERYVSYGQMANQAAEQTVVDEMGLDLPSMFIRHIGVFDSANRDTRGWYIANVFYAVVDYSLIANVGHIENFELISEDQIAIDDNQIAYDHRIIAKKVIDNLKNDIFTQIFNKTLFETDVISELLGRQFSAKDLQLLGEYVGLTYDRTTYYRNINKYYNKSGSVRVAGIKKPVTLYTKLVDKSEIK